MIAIGKELIWFFQALLTGSIIFWIYQLILIARRLIRHKSLLVSLEDFFFWTCAGIYIFIQMHNTSTSGLRWHFVLGVVLGAFLPVLAKKKWKKVIDKSKKKR